MLAAPVAELLQFQSVRRRLAVLRRRIIPLFAITALHRDNFSGHKNSSWLLALSSNKTDSDYIVARLVLFAALFLHPVLYQRPRRSADGKNQEETENPNYISHKSPGTVAFCQRPTTYH
jgi:hypothetical protein